MNVYVSGDCHKNFKHIKKFCEKMNTTTDDVLILLGDVGINIYGNKADEYDKKNLSKLPITLFCIRGNHEARPEHFPCYKKRYITKFLCNCWVDENYPNIYFPECGVCWINNHRCLICDGAYSVDKWYRLQNDKFWVPDEQMTESEKNSIWMLVVQSTGFDYVFSHTAPLRFEPTQLFLSMIDQSKVDKSTEEFLDKIYEEVSERSCFKKWYCGHYHADMELGEKVQMLYHSFDVLE